MSDRPKPPEALPGESGTLSRKYIEPPFDVLLAGKESWSRRKREWRTLNLKGDYGRADRVHGAQFADPEYMKKFGRATAPQVSIFDPVLTELMVLWFSNRGDQVFDAFAGASTRGVITGLLDRDYTGVELQEAQVNANLENYDEVLLQWRNKGGDTDHKRPRWIHGDSVVSHELVGSDYRADFALTCPPYGNLEIYSNDPKDLSNMRYSDFLENYCAALRNAVNFLRDNRFFVIVVGEFRDERGGLMNFVGDTATICRDLGMVYVNEAILVTAPNTAPLRAERPFQASRKMTRIHQNVLVFCKGDPKEATERLTDELDPIRNLYALRKGAAKLF